MATLILIDGDAELLRARALVDQLWNSTHPGDFARLEAQARLVAAYEEMKWPRRPPSVADLIRHLMDQHGLTRVAPPPKKPPPRPTREASPVGTSTSKAGRRRPKAAQAEAVGVVLCETNPIFSKTLALGHELFRSPSSVREVRSRRR
jgi:hypothetical protein